MPEEIKQLNRRIEVLENIISQFAKSERYIFEKDVQFQDGRNIQTGKGTGTKIGTDTDQKVAFFGAPPETQAANIALANTPGASYVQAEMIDISSKLNTVILRLERFGFNAS